MSANKELYRAYIISTIAGVLAFAVTLPLFSFLIWFLQLPAAMVTDTFSVLSFGAGCLISGIAAGRLRRKGGLFSGVKAAVIMLGLLIIIVFVRGFFGFGDGVTGEFLLGRMTTALLCGAVGGVIGVNKRLS